jgi:hypothetical protein
MEISFLQADETLRFSRMKREKFSLFFAVCKFLYFQPNALAHRSFAWFHGPSSLSHALLQLHADPFIDLE